ETNEKNPLPDKEGEGEESVHRRHREL
nr:Chain H, CG4944-PC, isoform C